MKKKITNISSYNKIVVSFFLLFLVLIAAVYTFISITIHYELDRHISQELLSFTDTAVEMANVSSQLTIKNHLKTEVTSVQRVTSNIQKMGADRGLPIDDLKKEAADYILNQSIGDTGYFYVIDSQGTILVHPFPELVGSSVLEYNFIKTQISEKSGYLEYDWQNPGDATVRPKALYMTYFEPWDWIISASAYKSEFRYLVNVNDVRDGLKKIQIGKNGYIFILDQHGNFLIHPEYEGMNFNDLSSDNEIDTSFFKTILSTQSGEITYKWRNPEGKRITEKALLYHRIPDLDWVVVSSIFLDEYKTIKMKMNWFLFLTFIVTSITFWLISRRISKQLSSPLETIIHFVDHSSESEHTGRLAITGSDEYSRLSLHINRFLDTIENEKSSRHLVEEDNKVLAQFIHNNPYPVIRTNETGDILYQNRASINLLAFWEATDNLKLPEDLIIEIKKIDSDFGEIEYRSKNQFYDILVSYFSNQKGFFIFVNNTTSRKKDEYLLIMSESVFAHTMEGICITDRNGQIVRVNPAFTEITGYPENEVVGKNPRILKSDHHPPLFYKEMWNTLLTTGEWSGEIWNRRKNGDAYPELLTLNSIMDSNGITTHYVGVFKDISEIKDSEEKLRHQAFHDALTSLPNRTLFLDRLSHSILHAERISGKLAIIFLDMDNFKIINDSLGHHEGDKYLQEIGKRLSSACREEDTVARLGGDEFVVLIPEVANQHFIVEIINRIMDALSKSLTLKKHEFHPSVSIGVATYPDDGDDALTLMKNADLAMYKSKENGKGISTHFNYIMNLQLQKKIKLERLLKLSLKKQEIHLVYQPKVSTSNLRITGAEALVRWESDELGLIPPTDFIGLAEETGFILELGDWVLKQALTDLSDFQTRFSKDFEMAVNLSVRQFLDEDLITRITQIVDESKADPARINLEITENMAMENSETALVIINQLKKLNVLLSIDDFGTGYSSYNYLKQFRTNTLKIDKSFVDEIPQDEKSKLIMKNIIDLGHILNMEVVAEGVEKEEQFLFLKESGCDLIQGYYFSKPLKYQAFIDYCSNRNNLISPQ